MLRFNLFLGRRNNRELPLPDFAGSWKRRNMKRLGVGSPAPPAELSPDKLQICIPVSPQLYLGTASGKQGIKTLSAAPPHLLHAQSQKEEFCLHHLCCSQVILGHNWVFLGAWWDTVSFQKEMCLLCVPGEISMWERMENVNLFARCRLAAQGTS